MGLDWTQGTWADQPPLVTCPFVPSPQSTRWSCLAALQKGLFYFWSLDLPLLFGVRQHVSSMPPPRAPQPGVTTTRASWIQVITRVPTTCHMPGTGLGPGLRRAGRQPLSTWSGHQGGWREGKRPVEPTRPLSPEGGRQGRHRRPGTLHHQGPSTEVQGGPCMHAAGGRGLWGEARRASGLQGTMGKC